MPTQHNTLEEFDVLMASNGLTETGENSTLSPFPNTLSEDDIVRIVRSDKEIVGASAIFDGILDGESTDGFFNKNTRAIPQSDMQRIAENTERELSAILNNVAGLPIEVRLQLLKRLAAKLNTAFQEAIADISIHTSELEEEASPPYKECAEFKCFPSSKKALGAKNAWDVIRIVCEKNRWRLPYLNEISCHRKLYNAMRTYDTENDTKHLPRKPEKTDLQLLGMGIDLDKLLAEGGNLEAMSKALNAASFRLRRKEADAKSSAEPSNP